MLCLCSFMVSIWFFCAATASWRRLVAPPEMAKKMEMLRLLSSLSTVKVHAIKRWLNESIETPAGFLVTKCSSVVWTCSVGRLCDGSSSVPRALSCEWEAGCWNGVSWDALCWITSLHWPPAPGWFKPEEWVRTDDQKAQVEERPIFRFYMWYANGFLISCMLSAACLALCELGCLLTHRCVWKTNTKVLSWGTGSLLGLKMEAHTLERWNFKVFEM